MKKDCVVVILTFNSAGIIGETLGQALKVSNDVLVVDSGSTDDTCKIAESHGCVIMERSFKNYSDQRNWAIDQIVEKYSWQLHLDADEVLDELAVAEICNVVKANRGEAWMLRRRDYFMGKELKHSGLNPWHLRLFRSGVARCENRSYDQHFRSDGPAGRLHGVMHDKNQLTLSEWTIRHNRWADLEVEELLGGKKSEDYVLQPNIFGDARERTRFFKGVYYKMPGGLRALSYFSYRYFLRLGFLDGAEGFYYSFFQALWFRLLVDGKRREVNICQIRE